MQEEHKCLLIIYDWALTAKNTLLFLRFYSWDKTCNIGWLQKGTAASVCRTYMQIKQPLVPKILFKLIPKSHCQSWNEINHLPGFSSKIICRYTEAGTWMSTQNICFQHKLPKPSVFKKNLSLGKFHLLQGETLGQQGPASLCSRTLLPLPILQPLLNSWLPPKARLRLPCSSFLLPRAPLAQAKVFFLKRQDRKTVTSFPRTTLLWDQATLVAGAVLCHHLVGNFRSAAVFNHCTSTSHRFLLQGFVAPNQKWVGWLEHLAQERLTRITPSHTMRFLSLSVTHFPNYLGLIRAPSSCAG